MNLYTQETKPKRPISGSAVARIVIWSVVLCILVGLFGLAILGSTFKNIGLRLDGYISLGGYRYDNASAYNVGNSTTAETIRSIDIDWLAGDIEILPADDDGVAVSISEDYPGEDDDHRLRWLVVNGELRIKFCKPYWLLGASDLPTKRLTIRLPASMLDALEQVKIDSVDSEITFKGNTARLKLDGVNCTLNATGHIGELDVDVVDGSVNHTGTAGELDLDGVNYRATLRLSRAGELDLDGVDIAVELYLPDTVTGFAVEQDALDGDILVEGFDGVTRHGDYDRYWGDGSLKIDLSGVDSKLTIKKTTNG